jgi:hypothetical protein
LIKKAAHTAPPERMEEIMALENRSKPRQILFLLLAFAGLVGVLVLLARWHL